MVTRKTNQLDIDVAKVSDPVARELFLKLGEMINTLVGTGLVTDGRVTALKGLSTGDLPFKAKVFTGVLAATGAAPTDPDDPMDHAVLIVPGLILGYCGHAQFDHTIEWRQMGRGSQTTTVYFDNADGKLDRVRVENSDNATNNYRVIIFYTEAEQL